MSKERTTITRWMLTLLVAGLTAAVVIFTGTRVAKAHIVPFPCDFTTGGGFVITDNGYHANFGLVGGCKHDGFFGQGLGGSGSRKRGRDRRMEEPDRPNPFLRHEPDLCPNRSCRLRAIR